jgi:hypothetical protein
MARAMDLLRTGDLTDDQMVAYAQEMMRQLTQPGD